MCIPELRDAHLCVLRELPGKCILGECFWNAPECTRELPGAPRSVSKTLPQDAFPRELPDAYRSSRRTLPKRCIPGMCFLGAPGSILECLQDASKKVHFLGAPKCTQELLRNTYSWKHPTDTPECSPELPENTFPGCIFPGVFLKHSWVHLGAPRCTREHPENVFLKHSWGMCF